MANGEEQIPASPEVVPVDRVTPVAGIWHTVLFVVILLGLAILQGRPQLAKGAHLPGRMVLYISTMIYEFFLLGYVWLLGLRRYKVTISEIIGGKWRRWGGFLAGRGNRPALLDRRGRYAAGVVPRIGLQRNGGGEVSAAGDGQGSNRVRPIVVHCGILRRGDFSRLPAAAVHGMDRERGRWNHIAVGSFRRRAPLPGTQGRGGDYRVRRDVWSSGLDGQEPAAGNHAAWRAGFAIRNRRRLPEEVSLPANHQVLTSAYSEDILVRSLGAVRECDRDEVAVAIGRGFEDRF